MDRRESLKTLMVGSLATGLVMHGCNPDTQSDIAEKQPVDQGYGRTAKEEARDARLMGEKFFTVHEMETIAVLCDLILPANDKSGSATDAGVPEFIEFISKDIPRHQVPIRGGIMWLDARSNGKFNLEFKACSDDQHKDILEEIAYPENKTPETEQGARFFTLMRNLTLTGYYTTKMGIEDLGYVGNQPNVWDGVPDEVLKKHGLQYEPEWLAKCIDQDTRDQIATWDEEGNLLP